MRVSSWPSTAEVNAVKERVVQMSGGNIGDVRIVVSPYRICPLGAHIDHQGGIVSAMTINKGIILGFIPSDDGQIILQSGQFDGDVRFKVDVSQLPRSSTAAQENGASKSCNKELDWGCYARGAVYALQRRGFHLDKGIIGFICGSDGLDSSGLSSSAAVGVAYLLALENANSLIVSQTDNIELDRLIENEYLGLRNGILDQSAVLLSKYGCLMRMNCKTKEHNLVRLFEMEGNQRINGHGAYKILLAFSGLKHALANNPGYNSRVSECQEAARLLLCASGDEDVEPLLCNVDPSTYEAHKAGLEPNLAKRAKHYFTENFRVKEGLKAWASGELETFGKLISASGLSSIENYECGCEPMIQLYQILVRAPGVYGARFSGAGFRGCCLALVDADRAEEAASFVKLEYPKVQPKLANQLKQDKIVLICEAGDCAQIL
ncbi:galacturonokinase protein [Dioscorea alata]|uniref:Galacturonokinase protein n=1 Tax=Dioscorea alata TaxID=55571 RepID=A0ACB7VDA3_DIOAL|nr:galacturonokinase protein [Dioscorea alata]